MRNRFFPVLATAAVALIGTACAEQGTPVATEAASASFAKGENPRQMEGTVWVANLKPLNAHVTERAVTGKATFIVNNGMFTAILDVKGVTPDHVHPQHIHGFLDATDATCPTPQADDDGDHIISVEEGGDTYGPVLVPLDEDLENTDQQLTLFPMPDDFDYHYEETVALSEIRDYQGIPATGDLNLEIRHVVVHGAFVDGVYNPVLPVACGEIKRVR